MGREIERKFLVTDPSVVRGRTGTPIRQGYLSLAPARTVRVRRAGDRGFVTIKGAGTITRNEYEYEIPVTDADELLEHASLRPLIEKTRYAIEDAGHHWSVDVFDGENAGLVVAEVELEREDEAVEPPPWLGPDVTADHRYTNARLVRNPYRSWPDRPNRDR